MGVDKISGFDNDGICYFSSLHTQIQKLSELGLNSTEPSDHNIVFKFHSFGVV
jgi:hypothetical protein